MTQHVIYEVHYKKNITRGGQVKRVVGVEEWVVMGIMGTQEKKWNVEAKIRKQLLVKQAKLKKENERGRGGGMAEGVG